MPRRRNQRLRGLAAVGNEFQGHLQSRGEFTPKVNSDARVDGGCGWWPTRRTRLPSHRVHAFAIDGIAVVNGDSQLASRTDKREEAIGIYRFGRS
jgi:hypothetical protein